MRTICLIKVKMLNEEPMLLTIDAYDEFILSLSSGDYAVHKATPELVRTQYTESESELFERLNVTTYQDILNILY